MGPKEFKEGDRVRLTTAPYPHGKVVAAMYDWSWAEASVLLDGHEVPQWYPHTELVLDGWTDDAL